MRIPNGRAYSAIITSQSSHTSLSGGGGGWPAVERAATKEDSKITVNSKETHLFASTQSVVPMKYKKPKLKPLHNGNALLEDAQITKVSDEKLNNNKRKSKSPIMAILEKEQPPIKKSKTEFKKSKSLDITNNPTKEQHIGKEAIIKRSDSPGLDLSVFQPRGKRKCVIQNELKSKQRSDDWWSDDDEEEEEIDDDEDDDVRNDGDKLNDRSVTTTTNGNHNNNHPHEDEDDEIEEEIPDIDDDEEEEVEIKDEDSSEEEIEEVDDDVDDDDDDDAPLVAPQAIQKQNVNVKKKTFLNKQPSMDFSHNDLSNNTATLNTISTIKSESTDKPIRCFVFSTAMANRAGHAVSKGLFNTISAYHGSQKWEMDYLSSELHCRPFNAALEDALAQRDAEEKQKTSPLNIVKGNKFIEIKQEETIAETTASVVATKTTKIHENDAKVTGKSINGVKKEEQNSSTTPSVPATKNKNKNKDSSNKKSKTSSLSSELKTSLINDINNKNNKPKKQRQKKVKAEATPITTPTTHLTQNGVSLSALSSVPSEHHGTPILQTAATNNKVNPLHPRFHLFNNNNNNTAVTTNGRLTLNETTKDEQQQQHFHPHHPSQSHRSLLESRLASNIEDATRFSQSPSNKDSKSSPPASSISSVDSGIGIERPIVPMATDAPVLQRKTSPPPHHHLHGNAADQQRRRHSNTPPVLVCSVPPKLPIPATSEATSPGRHNGNSKTSNHNGTQAAAITSWLDAAEKLQKSTSSPSSSLSATTQHSSSTYSADVSSKKELSQYYRHNNRSSSSQQQPHPISISTTAAFAVTNNSDSAHLSPRQFALRQQQQQQHFNRLKEMKPPKTSSSSNSTSSIRNNPSVVIENGLLASSESREQAQLLNGPSSPTPPILPRDHLPPASSSHYHQSRTEQHASAFISRSPYNSAFVGSVGGITPNGKALYNPLLRNHQQHASSISPLQQHHHSLHYQQHLRDSRELLASENERDFAHTNSAAAPRNSVIIPPPPVRPSIANRTNGIEAPPSKTYEETYVPLTSSAVHRNNASHHHRNKQSSATDRPSSLPVSISDIYTASTGNGDDRNGKDVMSHHHRSDDRSNKDIHHMKPSPLSSGHHKSAFSVDSLTAKSSSTSLSSRGTPVTSSRLAVHEQLTSSLSRKEHPSSHRHIHHPHHQRSNSEEEAALAAAHHHHAARLLESRHFPSLPPHHPHHRLLPPPPTDNRIPPPPPSSSFSPHHAVAAAADRGGIHNGLKRTLDEQLSSNLLHAERRKYLEQLEWMRNTGSSKDSKRIEFERFAAAAAAISPQHRGGNGGHHPGFGAGSAGLSLSMSEHQQRSLYMSGAHLPASSHHHRITSNGHHRDLPSPPHHRLYSPYGRR